MMLNDQGKHYSGLMERRYSFETVSHLQEGGMWGTRWLTGQTALCGWRRGVIMVHYGEVPGQVNVRRCI